MLTKNYFAVMIACCLLLKADGFLLPNSLFLELKNLNNTHSVNNKLSLDNLSMPVYSNNSLPLATSLSMPVELFQSEPKVSVSSLQNKSITHLLKSYKYSVFKKFESLTTRDYSTQKLFSEKLRQWVNSRNNYFTEEESQQLFGEGEQYSHYIIDRLLVENNHILTDDDKYYLIQQLKENADFQLTELQRKDELGLLMNALAVLPADVESPQWRHYWFQQLQLISDDGVQEYRLADQDWKMRMSNYQTLRAQMILQFSDQPEVLVVVQEDLRNSYFSTEEIVLVSISDSTIDMLNQ